MIKYQTLSLQVSNAGGLKQVTTYISLLMLHSTITEQPCLVSIAPVQRYETIHVFEHFKLILYQTYVFWNFLLWQCQLQCNQSCQKLLHCHAHAELFCNISLHGERAQCPIAIVLQFWPKFYLLFSPTRLPLNQINLGLPQRHAK